MIEDRLVRFLTDRLNVPVYLEEEDNMPDSCIVLDKTGGSEENRISYATIAVQSYGSTKYNASVLNDRVKRALLDGVATFENIAGCSLNSDYDFTDTEEKRYRYQAVFEFSFYEGN